MAKNTMAKTRPNDKPYEIWQSWDGLWTYKVLKKWQADDHKPYARWFCSTTSPYVTDELGDGFAADIMSHSHLILTDYPE